MEGQPPKKEVSCVLGRIYKIHDAFLEYSWDTQNRFETAKMESIIFSGVLSTGIGHRML